MMNIWAKSKVSFGQTKDYAGTDFITGNGYNYRMPNILAAMGVAQLENINNFIRKGIMHGITINC